MDVAELMELAADGLPVVSAARAAGTETRSEQRPERQKEPLVEQGPEERQLSEESEALAKSMWRPLKSESCGEQISVVSFNMLLKGFDQKPYYPELPSTLRAWEWRKPQLVNLIYGMDADVYCMQEVECGTFAEEFSFLSPLYSAVPPKDDSKGKIPELAKCAIFFKTEKLQQIWHEHRSRVVLCALKHQTGQVIYFASCHLEGAPGEGRTRLTQLRKALQSIRKHQEQSGFDPLNCAMVFAGDFNEDESGPIVRSLDLKPGDTVDETELFAHGLHLADLYDPKLGPFSQRPPTFGAPLASGKAKLRAIDFVFYTCNTLSPVAVRAPLTVEQYEATIERSIPAEWHFSDHVPVGGIFQLSESKPSQDVLADVVIV